MKGVQSPAIRARRPWSIVWALSVTQIISWGSLYYAFSVLLVPMERELGWGRDTLVGAFSLSVLVAGAGAFPVGMLIDRVGGRWVMALGSVLAGVLFLSLAQINSVALFYAAWVGLGAAMAMLLYEPAFAVIYATFGAEARKGITALTLTAGFASTVFWPLSQWLVNIAGWRGAVSIMGWASLFVCAPLHVAFLPSASGGVSHAARRSRPGVLPRLFRAPAFWLLAISFTANMAAFSTLSVHLIPLLRERGFSAEASVLLAAVVGPMQVLGRVLEVTVGARFRPANVGLLALALLPIGLFALAQGDSRWTLLIAFAALYGASNGVMTIIRAVMPAELFGRESYGAINGALSAPVIVSRAVAPIVAAWLWSTFGNYGVVLWVLIALASAAVLGFALAVRRSMRSSDR
jgi:MFS family permease